MAIISGVFRIGRDPVLRHMPNGGEVLPLVVVYNYGIKGEDGNRPSQWMDCSLFGKRAVSLQPYLTKGTQVNLVIQDPHNETYQTKDGKDGVRFTGRILDIELIGGGQRQEQPVKQQMSKVDFDDDIPF